MAKTRKTKTVRKDSICFTKQEAMTLRGILEDMLYEIEEVGSRNIRHREGTVRSFLEKLP